MVQQFYSMCAILAVEMFEKQNTLIVGKDIKAEDIEIFTPESFLVLGMLLFAFIKLVEILKGKQPVVESPPPKTLVEMLNEEFPQMQQLGENHYTAQKLLARKNGVETYVQLTKLNKGQIQRDAVTHYRENLRQLVISYISVLAVVTLLGIIGYFLY